MIKVWDYFKQYENEKHEIYDAIKKVFKSGQLILGESVKNFEEEFSKYCGVKYGIGVSSGTDALFLALKALNIGQGDEVITVVNTAVPTVSAIVSAGAKPVLVDINPKTYLMDINQLEKVITRKTKCILPVHLFGQCVDMEAIQNIAQAHGLRVIEDCAQAHGAVFKGKKAGSMSDAAVFSFYPTKVLGGYGDGGMVITNEKALYRKLRRLRFYGMENAYYSMEHGYNSRLDELHAEILRRKLAHLDEYIARRRALAKSYDEKLKDTSLILPKTTPCSQHVFYRYVCRYPQRDRIIAELKKKEIIVNISYPWPIHIMPAYKYLANKKKGFPCAEAAAKEIFSLPMYPDLTEKEQKVVSTALHEILSNDIRK